MSNQTYQLFVETDFLDNLIEDIKQATSHIEIQFMTFEGDMAGWKLTNTLIKKAEQGIFIRILIDYFTTLFISDSLVLSPFVWREVWSTIKMIKTMRNAGIQVKFTNPWGLFFYKLLQRNHKKIVIVDEYCYIGGINMSDHNLAWHDFMVKMQGEATQIALEDFNTSWQGGYANSQGHFVTEKDLEQRVIQLLSKAKTEVILSSPYFMDLYMVDLLVKTAQRGVRVIVLTAEKNNSRLMQIAKPYLFAQLKEQGAELYYYKKFSHAKYLIIDQQTVMFGSSNFNYHSFRIKNEICYVSQAPSLVSLLLNLYQQNRQQAVPAISPPINITLSYLLNRWNMFVLDSCYRLQQKYR